eukprot:2575433-Pyramimonas_sp.AAC.1
MGFPGGLGGSRKSHSESSLRLRRYPKDVPNLFPTRAEQGPKRSANAQGLLSHGCSKGRLL